MVSFNFTDLPGGTYALAIGHATGVPQPQQIAIILAKSPPDKWLLAGLYSKPMIFEGHDGLWYWSSARKFAGQKNGNYGRRGFTIASPIIFWNPIDVMFSPESARSSSRKTGQSQASEPAGNEPHCTDYSRRNLFPDCD